MRPPAIAPSESQRGVPPPSLHDDDDRDLCPLAVVAVHCDEHLRTVRDHPYFRVWTEVRGLSAPPPVRGPAAKPAREAAEPDQPDEPEPAAPTPEAVAGQADEDRAKAGKAERRRKKKAKAKRKRRKKTKAKRKGKKGAP